MKIIKKNRIFFFNLLKPYNKKLLVLFIIMIVSIGSDLLQTIASARIIDILSQKESYIFLVRTICILSFIFIGNIVFGLIQQKLIANIEENIKYKVRMEIFNSILNKDIEFFNNKDVGELVSRILLEVAQIVNFIINTILQVILTILYVLVIIILMLSINITIGIYSLIFTFILLVVVLKVGYKVEERQSKVISNFSNVSNKVMEGIISIKTIKYLGIYKYIYNRTASVISKDKRVNIKFKEFIAIINSSVLGGEFIAVIVLWIYGSYLVIENHITIGAMVIISSYFQKLISNVNTFKNLNVEYQKFKVANNRLKEIIENNIELNFDNFNYDIKDISRIELKDLSMSYYTNLFKGMNITLNKGDIVNLIGDNGSGKTTLINIIMGIIKPTTGEILINNKKNYDMRSVIKYTELISIVPQNVELFSETVRENICLDKNFSDEEIINLSKDIGFREFNDEFLNRRIINRGLNLSGGQRQKIAILRALIRKPELLILDEAESNLDSTSRENLFKYIINTKNNRITLIVSHNISNEEFKIVNI